MSQAGPSRALDPHTASRTVAGCASRAMWLTCNWPEAEEPVADSGVTQEASDPGASFPWLSGPGQLMSHSEPWFPPLQTGSTDTASSSRDRTWCPEGLKTRQDLSLSRAMCDGRSPG